jgi:hypothetical protein
MQLDPRGVRFAATITTVVLALVLITGSGWLVLAQAVVFALPALFGMRFSPYGALFRTVARRLGPPAETEDAAPVRFSQTVGLVFTVVSAAGYLTGHTALGIVATAFRPARRVPRRRLRVLPRVRDVRPDHEGPGGRAHGLTVVWSSSQRRTDDGRRIPGGEAVSMGA